MKTKLLLILFGMLSCASLKNNSSNNGMLKAPKEALYKVYKIDSIHNYYLIYAKRNDTLYKIVSEKSPLEDCKSIIINHEYTFKLQSRNASRSLSLIKLSAEALLMINCFYYGDSTFICLERDSINDLHSADNVRGLCFLKDYKRLDKK